MDTNGRTREVQGRNQRAAICRDHMQGRQVRQEEACLFSLCVLSCVNFMCSYHGYCICGSTERFLS